MNGQPSDSGHEAPLKTNNDLADSEAEKETRGLERRSQSSRFLATSHHQGSQPASQKSLGDNGQMRKALVKETDSLTKRTERSRPRLMLFVSLMLHGLLLWVPLSPEVQKKPIHSDEKPPIKVVALPKKNQTRSNVLRQPTKRDRPSSGKQPSQLTSQGAASITPLAADSRSTAPSVSSVATHPFAEFPQYPGSQSGSLGLLTGEVDQASDYTVDALATVSAYFKAQLATRKFTVIPQIQDAQRGVYQVSKGGMTQVLNLIHREGQGTVIVLSDRVLDPSSRSTLVLDDLVTILNQYLPAEPSDFLTPHLFYAAEREHPATEGGFRLITEQTPETFFQSVLQNELQNKAFQVSQVGLYGGGTLYQVTQASFKRYINLMPSQDGTGTVVVLWTKHPTE